MDFTWLGQHLHIWLPPFVGFVIWMVRLEAKVGANTIMVKEAKSSLKDIDELIHALEIQVAKLETIASNLEKTQK